MMVANLAWRVAAGAATPGPLSPVGAPMHARAAAAETARMRVCVY